MKAMVVWTAIAVSVTDPVIHDSNSKAGYFDWKVSRSSATKTTRSSLERWRAGGINQDLETGYV